MRTRRSHSSRRTAGVPSAGFACSHHGPQRRDVSPSRGPCARAPARGHARGPPGAWRRGRAPRPLGGAEVSRRAPPVVHRWRPRPSSPPPMTPTAGSRPRMRRGPGRSWRSSGSRRSGRRPRGRSRSRSSGRGCARRRAWCRGRRIARRGGRMSPAGGVAEASGELSAAVGGGSGRCWAAAVGSAGGGGGGGDRRKRRGAAYGTRSTVAVVRDARAAPTRALPRQGRQWLVVAAVRGAGRGYGDPTDLAEEGAEPEDLAGRRGKKRRASQPGLRRASC